MEKTCGCTVISVDFKNGSLLVEFTLEVTETKSEEEIQLEVLSAISTGTFVNTTTVEIELDTRVTFADGTCLCLKFPQKTERSIDSHVLMLN